MSPETRPRVALLLIGNELLSGKIVDLNGPLCVALSLEFGFELIEMRVIPDDPQRIGESVRELSARADFVITSGGIGPTHDDLTLPSIAQGLSLPLEENPVIAERIRRRFGPDPEAIEVWMAMARVPQGMTVEEFRDDRLPILQLGNIFVLPGVPQLFEMQIRHLAPRFSGQRIRLEVLYIRVGEGPIAARLTEAAKRFPSVDIGSYPVWGVSEFKTRITFESTDEEAPAQAREWFQAGLDPELIHGFEVGLQQLKGQPTAP